MDSDTTDDQSSSAPRGAAFLTVEEAAAVLRIGRTAAYEATRRWRATGGAEGIEVVQVGGTLRVPRRVLEALAGGPIEFPATGSHRGPAATPTPLCPTAAPVEPDLPVRRRSQTHDDFDRHPVDRGPFRRRG